MTKRLGSGLLGMMGALLLAACSGTVNLSTGAAGATALGGFGAGGSPQWGGSGGASTAGSDGMIVLPPRPEHGVLAYDANPDALGRAIYLHSLGADGCAKRLTDPEVQAKQPAFSADGQRLAYAALVDGVYQIHVQDLASGDTQQLTELPLGASSPAFSPDGNELAFVTGDPEEPNNVPPGIGVLMLLDFSTLEVKTLSTITGCCISAYLSPVYNGSHEILVGTRTSLVGIDTETGDSRDLVPITGRIPNPQDPTPAPDGKRYAFSDYCGQLGLYIARIDGSTGDTCGAALPVPTPEPVVSADWGTQGFIAAEIRSAGHGVLLIDDLNLKVSTFAARTARNPAWAPADIDPAISCE